MRETNGKPLTKIMLENLDIETRSILIITGRIYCNLNYLYIVSYLQLKVMFLYKVADKEVRLLWTVGKGEVSYLTYDVTYDVNQKSKSKTISLYAFQFNTYIQFMLAK